MTISTLPITSKFNRHMSILIMILVIPFWLFQALKDGSNVK